MASSSPRTSAPTCSRPRSTCRKRSCRSCWSWRTNRAHSARVGSRRCRSYRSCRRLPPLSTTRLVSGSPSSRSPPSGCWPRFPRPVESRSAMTGHHRKGSRRLSQLLRITTGPYEFVARMEEAAAPKTCAPFLQRLPFRNQIIHARGRRESAWIPLGDFDFGIGFENATSYPAPGQVLLYPGGYSETEILFPYGACCFASKMGQLAGNHFLTIVEGNENLAAIGTMCLWKGAQDVVFEHA